jgi:plastocyanin/opacity protein-like surface antigen
MRSRLDLLACAIALSALTASPGSAQSVLDAPSNLANAWVAVPATIQFSLLHRFDIGPAPARKLTNSPTLGITAGIRDRVSLGFNYATNSELVQAYPNEWEFFGRAQALRQDDGAPLDAFVQGGYNIASRSRDAALILAREFGRLRLVATGEAFSHAFDSTAARYAAGAGFSLHLSALTAISADVASLTDRQASERIAWSGGIQFGVPGTPHTLSLHVTNVNSRTLEGVAKGTPTTRYGFEYSIPITLRRYFGSHAASGGKHSSTPETPPDSEPDTGRTGGPSDVEAPFVRDTVFIDMKSLSFGRRPRIEVPAGTVVLWRNRDPLAHVVAADDKSFESPPIDPASSWARKFDQPGTYGYHCIPHPFMQGTIVVK